MRNKADQLLEYIPQLDAVQFTGLARILKVELVRETNPDATDPKERFAAREFHEVLTDIVKNFCSANRARRREIIKILSAAARSNHEDADNS